MTPLSVAGGQEVGCGGHRDGKDGGGRRKLQEASQLAPNCVVSPHRCWGEGGLRERGDVCSVPQTGQSHGVGTSSA